MLGMEIAFHSNKCALKDTLRTLRIGKSPCWKQRQKLLSYSKGLIGTNTSIITLHGHIDTEEQKEFKKLIQLYEDLRNTIISKDHECIICMRNCLEDSEELTEIEEMQTYSTSSPTATEEESFHPEEKTPYALERKEEISQMSSKIGRLNEKAEYLESVMNVQNEDLNKTSYNEAFSIDYTNSHLYHLEEILARKRRTQLIRRWLGGACVFVLFLGILVIKPLLP
ncbi:hypothetical protein NEOKW01_1944 [Nematocida sp. AWRm80]|nr:hypothetical protein NEOKW01_1944 [Nematocida sp. AWRm80]